MNVRGALGLVLLLVALATGWYLLFGRDRAGITQAAAQRSDYTLHDFTLVSLDKDGKESFTLRAPLLTRSPDDKAMTLTTPAFQFPGESTQRWQATSKTGWVDAKGDEVRLRGDVVLASVDNANAPRMQTEQLDVLTQAKRATSAALVTITQPGLHMQGTGLDANLQTKRVILKSQVKARYAP